MIFAKGGHYSQILPKGDRIDPGNRTEVSLPSNEPVDPDFSQQIQSLFDNSLSPGWAECPNGVLRDEMPERGDDVGVQLALERNDQAGQVGHRPPCPCVELRLFARRRRIDTDFAL